jgi:hypothetical protein
MARPPLSDEAKRKQIAVRLGPRDRERVGRLAHQNGNSVGAEVEQLALDQLAYMENTDEKTRVLLGQILDNLNRIKTRANGRWHGTLTAWSAASEMLTHILDDFHPDKDRPFEDEAVQEAAAEASTADHARRVIVQKLAALNVLVREEPRPPLLGAQRFGLFGLAPSSTRQWEIGAINALPEHLKAKALPLFTELQRLDEESEAAWSRWSEAMRAFWEAEEEGRKIARELFGIDAKQAQLVRSLLKAPRLKS